MWRVGLIAGALLIFCLSSWDEALSLERAAIALSGSDCSHGAMIDSLERLQGVEKVEPDMIPDHLLIDYDGLQRTGEELAAFLNGLPALHGRCRAAVMQSCITAGTRIHALPAVAER